MVLEAKVDINLLINNLLFEPLQIFKVTQEFKDFRFLFRIHLKFLIIVNISLFTGMAILLVQRDVGLAEAHFCIGSILTTLEEIYAILSGNFFERDQLFFDCEFVKHGLLMRIIVKMVLLLWSRIEET